MVGTGSCCGESRPCWWSSVWWLGEWICRWSRCSAHQRLCQQSVCTDLSPGNLTTWCKYELRFWSLSSVWLLELKVRTYLHLYLLCSSVDKGTIGWGRSTVSGFILLGLALYLPSAYICVCIVNFFGLHPFIYLLSKLSLVGLGDWHLTWVTNHCPSVLWDCWLVHMTHKIVSEMTYNVLSGMVNPTIPFVSWLLVKKFCYC